MRKINAQRLLLISIRKHFLPLYYICGSRVPQIESSKTEESGYQIMGTSIISVFANFWFHCHISFFFFSFDPHVSYDYIGPTQITRRFSHLQILSLICKLPFAMEHIHKCQGLGCRHLGDHYSAYHKAKVKNLSKTSK